MEWNRDEWQGRTKKQVERNNKVFGYSVIMSIIVVVIVLVVLILN